MTQQIEGPASRGASGLDPAEWIEAAARERPERPFLESLDGRRLSYAELREQSGRYAAALARRGVRQGDRVLAQVEKSVDGLLLYAGCLRLGAVLVPINTANTAHEVDYFLRDSEPCLAVVRPADRELLETTARSAGVREIDTLGTHGEGSLNALARECAEIAPERSGGGAALAAIVYTSGTTGRSKGAMLTRGNLSSNAAALADAWRFSPDDVLLHTLPLFHIHGLFAALNTVLISGASVLLLPKFDAALTLEHLARATVYMGVPTHYTRMLQHPALSRDGAARMRLFISGSAPLLAETQREFERRTGHAILERYGMTETLIITSNPYVGVRKPGTVGPPLEGVSVRVADAGAGGAIEVRGPNVFAGYWRAPEKTRAEFTPDGWFKTGDLGRIDSDRYVHIVGRAKDLVISGGYNIYPKEVETELDALPGVIESAVFGVPHPDLGEGVTAVVVLHAGASIAEAQIIGSLRERLARYKVPRRVLVVVELPRNTMGKVQKNLLRASHATLYAGDAASKGSGSS
ncbi:MAG TPA: AMP-binding protein [Steroidobacteraceae bacterium]|jgi:malonyl-CoA/methylmalonyl-CoA synthetase|nr:AMP-binding protein [Steroidobacteraceae bacterium]